MKKFATLLIIFLGLFLAGGIWWFQKHRQAPSSAMKEETEGQKIEYYTCSMHPFIHKDKPGRCPICGMTLVPVYAEGGTPHVHEPTESAPSMVSELSTVRLSGEKQQLIGVTTEPVQRKMLVREIHAPGRVAYDPDLLVAQNEYLIALQTAGGELGSLQSTLVHAATLRLKLLGMSDAQIQQLKRKGKIESSLIVPEKGEPVWIYATLFESDLPWVKVGTPAQIGITGSSEPYSTSVESIDPTIDPMTRTAKARLRIPNPKGDLKPDMFVRVTLNAQAGEMLAIPNNAVLDTGTRQIAFVDQGNGRFEPRELKLGKRGTADIEVLSGVSEGERVVTNANFLIDSESRLKAAISGMVGHQH
jgi:Cu(I)/Ag(I) efflux system membrane fusion protein